MRNTFSLLPEKIYIIPLFVFAEGTKEMIKAEIKGLDKLQKEMCRISQDISRLTKKQLKKNAEMLVLEAQMLCPDSILRNSVRYEIVYRNDGIQIFIFADEKAKKYLEQAYENLKNKILKDVSIAVKNAIRG